MYCTVGDGQLNFLSPFFLAFHMTCSTCYSQERTTPHPPTKHVHKPNENLWLNTQVAIFSSFSLQVKVALLCWCSPHHSRISIPIRPVAWLLADEPQLVRALPKDSFGRANCLSIPRSSAGHCPARQERCPALTSERLRPPPGGQLLPGKQSSSHSTTGLQTDLLEVASAMAGCYSKPTGKSAWGFHCQLR